MDRVKREETVRKLKRIGIVLLVVLSVGHFVGVVVHQIRAISSSLIAYEVEDNFRAYKQDFETLARLFSRRFEKELNENENLSHVFIYDFGDNLRRIVYIYKDNTPGVGFSEAWSEEEKSCYDRLFHCVFTQHVDNKISFMGIRVSRNQVAFMTTSSYAIVYAKHWPTYVYDPEKEHGPPKMVDPIGIHWYQII